MRRALGITVGVAALVALAIGGAWLWSIRPWRVVASVNGAALTARELDLRAAAYGGDRREMARTWIAKEVLLGEAVQRSVSVAEADERAAKDILAAWLANAGTTPERFFSEGPLPEEARRQDFKEGLLIHALVKDALRTARFAEFYAALRGKADVRCPEFPELERLDTGTPLYVGLWGWRPARVAAAADGQVVTSAELDLRVRNALDDLRRTGQAPSKEREAAALPEMRRREVRCWIVKVVMGAEAVRRGFTSTPDDEKNEMARIVRPLKAHKLTVAQFFKEGVLPESLKLEDFRTSIRVNKFMEREMRDKINVTTQEIEARMAELARRAQAEAAHGGKATTRSDRKTAINQLRRERYMEGYRDMFRSLYGSARVWSPEFPEMERIDGVVSPNASVKEFLK